MAVPRHRWGSSIAVDLRKVLADQPFPFFFFLTGMNTLVGYDLVPEPKIIDAALRACRRLNDFASAVRILEVVKVSVTTVLEAGLVVGQVSECCCASEDEASRGGCFCAAVSRDLQAFQGKCTLKNYPCTADFFPIKIACSIPSSTRLQALLYTTPFPFVQILFNSLYGAHIRHCFSWPESILFFF